MQSFVLALTAASAATALKVVPIDIAKHPTPHLTRRHLTRDTIAEGLANNVTSGSYIANVSVGTPPQPLSLIVDTGSSDLWMLASSADLCNSPRLQKYYQSGPCAGGTFNPDDSSTYKMLIPGGFDIQYQDQTGSSGDYISDNVLLGDSTVKGLQMGLAYNTTVPQGIMGVGYDTNEAAQTQYPNIIDLLAEQDLINSKAYSLWLNDLDASTGSILFGGVDTDKYVGDLISVPIQGNARGKITSFTVAWTSFSITTEGGEETMLSTDGFKQPAILDSGTTLTYIPDSLANKLYTQLDAVDDTSNTGYVFVNCDLRTSASKATVNYGFGGDGGPVINVTLDELMFDLDSGSADDRDSIYNLPFQNTCILGVYGTSMDGGVILLGDTFLRSAYVVYDLTNNKIAMAPTNFNATSSHIVEIQSAGIPNVSGVATGVTVSQTATGNPGVGTSTPTTSGTSGTSTTSASSTATSTTSSSAAHVVPALDMFGIGFAAWSAMLAMVGASMLLA